MASDVEKIMDEFEAALDVLQASHNEAGASLHLRERLAGARANADKARASRSSVENEYRAAIDGRSALRGRTSSKASENYGSGESICC
jgi:hypothetical protein